MTTLTLVGWIDKQLYRQLGFIESVRRNMPVSSLRPPRPSAWQHYLLLIGTESGRKARFRGPGAQTFFSYGPEKRTHLKREYLNRFVKHELKHIPRGETGSLQNFLRFSYNALRRRHLTLNRTRHETLKELVERIQKAHPDFKPQYDKEYFKI